jgi:hypothetical protein
MASLKAPTLSGSINHQSEQELKSLQLAEEKARNIAMKMEQQAETIADQPTVSADRPASSVAKEMQDANSVGKLLSLEKAKTNTMKAIDQAALAEGKQEETIALSILAKTRASGREQSEDDASMVRDYGQEVERVEGNGMKEADKMGKEIDAAGLKLNNWYKQAKSMGNKPNQKLLKEAKSSGMEPSTDFHKISDTIRHAMRNLASEAQVQADKQKMLQQDAP